MAADHLRRAQAELDGVRDRPSHEETLPPTDDEVEAAIRWLEENAARRPPSDDALVA